MSSFYIPRYLEDTIRALHRTFKIIYLGGPRQVGKTTLLMHLAKRASVRYVTLDDFAARRLAQTDPELFLDQHPPPCLIDEVQYAPELFPVLKLYVDRRPAKGQYWLTGSQQFALLHNIQESLTGRVGIVHLLGFSLGEVRRIPKVVQPFIPGRKAVYGEPMGVKKIFQAIMHGSFPALWQRRAPPREAFYSSYIQTYLDRDLRELFGVEKLSEFHTFLQLCAGRTGQTLNYTELSKDAGVSVHAVREWLNILEQTMHVYLLRPYFQNRSKRLIKSPKLYFLDTGFAAYLTRWTNAEVLERGAMAGAFFETLVISEIIKSYLFRGQEPPLYYFRDKEGHEVDCIIEQMGQAFPVEVKLGSRIEEHSLKGLRYFQKKFKNAGHGAVVALGDKYYPLDKNIDAIPVWMVP